MNTAPASLSSVAAAATATCHLPVTIEIFKSEYVQHPDAGPSLVWTVARLIDGRVYLVDNLHEHSPVDAFDESVTHVGRIRRAERRRHTFTSREYRSSCQSHTKILFVHLK
jgi:hypothetical protein